MKAASAQTVDRMLGVLVAVCASAVLVAIGARAGSSLSTLLRLTYNEASSQQASSSSKKKKQKGGSNRSRRPREEGREDSSAAGDGMPGDSDSSSSIPEDGEEDGDAYHAYAYGARSAAVRRRTGGGGDGEGRLVMHCGSCHCGGLVFEVKAPEHLVAIEGASKVRYPFITVLAEHFRLTSDDSNGSLYLLKCRSPTGRDSTLKVSAHFFCRRCGVHVVHAPDFPHAAVANVNVHCIRPSTIRSLAVGFLRGGGEELPGIGDPVEGVYEVGRESSWSDAMRERVSVALQQQQQQQQQQTLGGTFAASSSNSRALSPRRRASSFASAPSAGRESSRSGKGGITALGAGGARRAPDVSTLRRNAEERERARQHAGLSNSSTYSSSSAAAAAAAAVAAGMGGGGGNSSNNRPTGSTWGDVLMHVVSLPSSFSSSTQPRKAELGGAQGASANGGEGAWGPRTSEDLLRAERRGAAALSGENVGVGGVHPTRVGRSMSRRADGAGDVRGSRGREEVAEGGGVKVGLRRRRSFSMDSTATPHATVSSPGAQGVAFNDNAENSTGGSPSSAGGTVLKNGPEKGAQTGAGGGGPRANGVDYILSRDGEGERVSRPPPAEGLSGGYAAAQA